MQNISSEQELKQLLEEGRITEEEYKELLEVIRKKETLKQTAGETEHSVYQMSDWKKGLLVGFLIAILNIMTALIITIIFDIRMLKSMSFSWLAVLPILLVIKGLLWLRRKNS